jgi:hypothetical protein
MHMISLLVEIDPNRIRVSEIRREKGLSQIGLIHDPFLNVYLEVLAEGRSMGDVTRAIETAVKRETGPASTSP